MACYFNGKDPLGTGKPIYGVMQPGALNSQLFDWYKDVADAWATRGRRRQGRASARPSASTPRRWSR